MPRKPAPKKPPKKKAAPVWRRLRLSDEFLLVLDEILQWDKEKTTKEKRDEKTQDYITIEWERNVNQLRAIFLSDEELIMLTNERLKELKEEDKQINYRTIQRYKSLINWEQRTTEEVKNNEHFTDKEIDLLDKFCRLMKKHLIKQKQLLFQWIVDDKLRQRYAWITERKFDEWNIRMKIESKNENTNENFTAHIDINHMSEDERKAYLQNLTRS